MPPKYVPIKDVKSGTKVEACYLLQNFQQRPKKDGSCFVTLALKDATGKITGVMWDNFENLLSGAIKENDFVEVSGDILTYNNQLQFKINKIARIDDDDVESSYFLPTCQVPMSTMEQDLSEFRGQIADPDLRKLVDCFFENPAFMKRFRRAPSAVSMHQAYIGGLFEHTLCVVKNALKIAENYSAANRSLLIAAGLLHDIGKTVEFTYDKKIMYSDVGRLLGHISIGNAMVECECSRLADFPLAKKVLVQHMILSHHGLLEYGSPRRPKTLEALILHHADQLDAHLSNYMEYATNAQRTGTRWEYSNMFERYLFAPHEEVDGCELFREISYRPQPAIQAEPAPDEMMNAVPSDDLMEGMLDANLPKS